jgi:diadenosine tetraphosphate (Ap4A) HIT family hydrolase
MPFVLHPQLETDTHRLGRFDLCHLLLHRNAAVPWFILVPETDLPDLLDLPVAQQRLAMDEASRISAFIKRELDWPKVNFGAIGNLVPQLHLHVVGRRPGDACWPAPVWGNLTASSEYAPATVVALSASLADLAKLQPVP